MKSIKKMVLVALLASILVISKEMLAFLPNIELVSFLLIIYTLALGKYLAILVAVIFAFIQTLLYGVGTWTPMYFIVWPLLCLLCDLLKKHLDSEFKLAIFSGLFGLVFGFMFAIPYFVIGFNLGWSYFLNGLFFDLIHCIGNYLVMLVLYAPVYSKFKYLCDRFF